MRTTVGERTLTLILCCAHQIADFGLSRVLLDASVSTGTYGTVTHMPPELLTTGAVPGRLLLHMSVICRVKIYPQRCSFMFSDPV